MLRLRGKACHGAGAPLPAVGGGNHCHGGTCHRPNVDCAHCPLAIGADDIVVALVGNPNVGKSSIYNGLTGQHVTTANYAGKTVELSIARTVIDGQAVMVIDTPGTYSLQGFSEDQRVARHGLTDRRPDVVVIVLDASNLRRNLQLYGEVADLGLPVIVALNLADEALRLGRRVRADVLARTLGVPVVTTNGQTGAGLPELARAIMSARTLQPATPLRLSPPAETILAQVGRDVASQLVDNPPGLSQRAFARLLIEDDNDTWALVPATAVAAVRTAVTDARAQLQQANAWPLAAERVRAAGVVADKVVERTAERHDWLLGLWRASLDPRLGPLLLLLVVAALGWFMFAVGGALSTALGGAWQTYVTPLVVAAGQALFGAGAAARIFTWTFGSGVEAILTIGVPFVFTFELILSLLEDSGYLNAAAYLTDSAMHRIGLNGRAIIPMIAGAGCNVPAIIGTRILTDRRERFIASTLITLVPCSARIAVILGSVGVVSGWGAAAALGLTIILIIAGLGWALNRLLPGRTQELVMEMFPLRRPLLTAMLKRTWSKFVDFLTQALPLMIVGSFIVGLLYETGLMYYLVAPLRPIVSGILGLPSIVAIALVFAALRKELALQLTLALAAMVAGTASAPLTSLMDAKQIFVFALVSSLYIPCLATYGVLARELGKRQAAAVTALTLSLAVAIGFVARMVLALV
ncbi:MAG: ferrous iron transport protein B [Chloroflexota bacterium]